MKKLLILLAIIIFYSGCKGPLSNNGNSQSKTGVHKVVVEEIIQAGKYTYLYVSEKRNKIWVAVPSVQVSKGDKVTFTGGMEMVDFHSKELDRTFPSVLFLEGINMESGNTKTVSTGNVQNGAKVKPERADVSIDPGDGCISIAKLLESGSDYEGKKVKVRGIITKVNSGILNKNWIHIQDGTEYNGRFDLTITTNSEPAMGDTVTFQGNISLKKDFGYGYFYELIMEDGQLTK